MGPYTAPLNPPFQVAFGTVIPDSAFDLTQSPPPAFATSAWTQLNIFLTPDATACPSPWLNDGAFPETDHDVRLLWLAVQAPTSSPFTGTYQAFGEASPFGDQGPFIVSGLLAKGTMLVNGFTSAEWATGSISITRYVDGKEVAGSFDAQFPDGTHLTGSFDLPVCVPACGAQ